MARSVHLVLVMACAACAQIAGVSDLRTGDLDAGVTPSGDGASSTRSASSASSANVASSASSMDASAAADRVSASEGAAPIDASPFRLGCSGAQVELVIEVTDSTPGVFTGVTDGNGLFSSLFIGDTFDHCVDSGLALDLRALPNDPSDASHDWGACGSGRRCEMTVTAPTVLRIDLL